MGLRYHRIISRSLFGIFLLLFFSFPALTTPIDTLIVNQTLEYPNTLISSNSKFRVGFFTPPNSTHRYLGVMYNLPVMTVVWVANRNNPLYDLAGALKLSSDGNLVILDRSNDIVWSTNLSNPVAADSKAVLLDTGNLVLQDNSNSSSIWESFQHASDSFLPTMKIVTDISRNEKNMLTSWRSISDPAPGNFTLTIEPRVVPQLFIWNNNRRLYWRSGPWNRQIFTGIPQMNSNSKQGTDVVSNSVTSAYATFSLSNSSLMYGELSTSGELVKKVWSAEKGEWEIMWSSKGSECDVYGKCGAFGRCDARKRPICGCLHGFVPKRLDEWETGNWTSGCIRRTSLGCEENKEDGFVKMESVKLPDGGIWFAIMEAECRVECLDNCSCVAYSHVPGIGCMHWDGSLIDVQRLYQGVTDIYIRLATSELGNKKKRNAVIAVAAVLGSVVILLLAYFVRKLFKYRGRRVKNEMIWSTTELEKMLQANEHGVKLDELPIFNFEMLLNATQNFALIHKLGQGGFGPVYKGKLPNGVEIAVKRLARSSNQGVEEFVNEVKVISRLQHRNLVRLLGCCIENEEKMLVYEYMPNGSLDSYLFDSHKQWCLDWRTRRIIIHGISRGLLYLHRDSRLRIIHRDLKASNILLDEDLNPKISDFGMARIFCGQNDQANTTRVVGTYGYMAPEYALHGVFSEKSDVFSFGVLLLEILSGKKNGHNFLEDQTLFLVAYAWKLWNEGNIVNLIDPTIYDPKMERDMQRYANVGLLCVQEIAAERPNVSTLVSMLTSEIVDLPHPNKPAFLGIQRSSQKNSTKYSLNEVSMTSVQGR